MKVVSPRQSQVEEKRVGTVFFRNTSKIVALKSILSLLPKHEFAVLENKATERIQ